MDENTVRTSSLARTQFIREFDLPIDLVEEPYFSQRLITMDCIYGCRKMWDLFVADLVRFPSVRDYIKEYFEVFDDVRDRIQHAQASIDDDTLLDEIPFSDIPMIAEKENILTTGKMRVEFRLEDNGYQILQKLVPKVLENETWEDFLLDFTSISHLKYSPVFQREAMKGVRMIQIKTLVNSQINECVAPLLSKRYVNPDLSVQYELKEYFLTDDLVQSLRQLPPLITDSITYDFFIPQALGDHAKYGYLLDYFISEEVELRNVDPAFANQIVLYLKRDHIMKSDLKFNYQGNLAKFMQPIPNPLTYYPSKFMRDRA